MGSIAIGGKREDGQREGGMGCVGIFVELVVVGCGEVKVMRRERPKTLGRRAIDMVSAWATTNRLVLGQRKVDEKSNEITAIPELLRLLDLEGCIVTIDAMGCQTKIAEQIVEQGGDYLLAVKANQGHLHEDIAFLFDCAHRTEFKGIDSDYTKTVSQGHGRIEMRECWIIDDHEQLDFIRDRQNWSNLQTIAMIRSKRQEAGKTTTQQHGGVVGRWEILDGKIHGVLRMS